MSLSAVLTLLCGAAVVTASGSFETVFITGHWKAFVHSNSNKGSLKNDNTCAPCIRLLRCQPWHREGNEQVWTLILHGRVEQGEGG